MKRKEFLRLGALAGLGALLPARTANAAPGDVLDYVEITANVNVSQTLAQGCTTIITGNPIAFDGSTNIKIEFYAQVVQIPPNYYDFNLGVWDETNTLIDLLIGRSHSSSGYLDVEGYAAIYPPLFPAGTKTFTIKAYRSPGSPSSPSAIVAAGPHGSPDFPPAYYRVTVAP